MLLHLKNMRHDSGMKNKKACKACIFWKKYFYVIATFLEPCVMRNTKREHNGQICPFRRCLHRKTVTVISSKAKHCRMVHHDSDHHWWDEQIWPSQQMAVTVWNFLGLLAEGMKVYEKKNGWDPHPKKEPTALISVL